MALTAIPVGFVAGLFGIGGGNNELVLSETINRCLRQIYDLQLVISENMQEKSINVYPDPNKTIKLD